MKNDIIKKYIDKLDKILINSEIIEEFLIEVPLKETSSYEFNLTPALFMELDKEISECKSSINLESINKIQIDSVDFKKIDIIFEEPLPRCCVFNNCYPCCKDEFCRNDKNYPILFLHGHAISKETSAEYSLEGFNQIQKKMEEQGFLNAGSITLFTEKKSAGIWGNFDVPLTFRGSYYFDIFQEPENYIVVQTKSESIDTYSIRLKELIDIIKYKTGKPKIKIIAFSMGGLVARKYLQVFGSSDVDRLIMIGTPNKGIVGEVADYCNVVGEKLECRDMNSESLFINKLNRGSFPDIPVFNIIGSGCKMEHGDGDGAVLKDKAILERAENHIIKGKCRSKLYPLHLDLRNINMYPEVYEIIKDSLG